MTAPEQLAVWRGEILEELDEAHTKLAAAEVDLAAAEAAYRDIHAQHEAVCELISRLQQPVAIPIAQRQRFLDQERRTVETVLGSARGQVDATRVVIAEHEDALQQLDRLLTPAQAEVVEVADA